jgi:hypothetical protein
MATNQEAAKPDHIMSYGSGSVDRLFIMVTRFFKNITVEPVVFFYAVGFSITMVISPNLYFEKTCTVSSQKVPESSQNTAVLYI